MLPLLSLSVLPALALPFPMVDPVAVEIGPVVVRWYALAYIVGLLLGWMYVRRLGRRPPAGFQGEEADDFLVWATLGVILGGRLGYVLFYNLPYYLENPAQILMVWQGGMAFHGGLLGVVVALLVFCRRRGINPLVMGDVVACAAPIGLFFGRIANFINAELYGRPAPDLAWAMVFPTDPLAVPRHPSQLYEAALEGLVLFVLLAGLWRLWAVRGRPGALVGVFLTGYGLARALVEVVREPDAHLGPVLGAITMGQVLSLPMILTGLAVLVWAWRRPPLERPTQA